MVLLTAIKNFRQYRSRKGNALPFEDLSCVSVVQDYCQSANDMEIERYHAAFPALGTSPTYADQFHVANIAGDCGDNVARRALHTSAPKALDVNGNTSVRGKNLTSTYSRSPRVQHAKEKTAHFNSAKDYNRYKKDYSKRSPKLFVPKARKVNRDCHAKFKNSEKQRKLDWKPWKHLEPVSPEECLAPELPPPHSDATAVAKSDQWLSEAALQTALAEEVDTQLVSSREYRSLWTQDSPAEEDERVWQFPVTGDSTSAFEAAFIADTALLSDKICEVQFDPAGDDDQVPSDYDFIEQSLASFKLCEDLPDVCQNSKLMPLFRENPLSYLMMQSRSDTSDSMASLSNPAGFSCKHCQEAYEVVLDLEAPVTNDLYSNDVLRHVDTRLNFDWCKYNPPPLAMEDTDVSDKGDDSHARFSCDCEYCRSRSWSRVCRVCGTPL